MNVRKVRRMCSVKGCRCTDTYAISKSAEYGGVIICRDCLEKALAAVNSGQDGAKKREKTPAPPLFFHPENGNPEGKKATREKRTTAKANDKKGVRADGDKQETAV